MKQMGAGHPEHARQNTTYNANEFHAYFEVYDAVLQQHGIRPPYAGGPDD